MELQERGGIAGGQLAAAVIGRGGLGANKKGARTGPAPTGADAADSGACLRGGMVGKEISEEKFGER